MQMATPAAASVGNSTYAQSVMSDSPRAYWRLGESSGVFAVDETSNGNVGSMVGGVTLGQPGALVGDPDTAALFDGIDDHIMVPDGNSLDMTTGATVEAWVKRSKNAAYQVIVGKPGNGQSKYENYALWLNTGNQPSGYFGNGTTYVGITSSTAIDTNWHQLVTTYDNQTARIYIDGQLSKSITSTVQLTPNADSLNIARELASNTYRFGGLMDDVSVYGAALSATRIKAHYDAGIGVDTVAPTVTLTSPANGSTVTTGTPTFSGAAGAAGTDSSTVTVKVYAGTSATGTPVQTRQATRSGSSWSVAASPALADGTYTARAEQTDTAGNTGLSGTTTFTVDTSAPAVTLTSPANGTITSDATPTFAGAAGTGAGDSTTVTVKVYSGTSATGSPVQTRDATRSGGSWTIDASPALADGTYTAVAEQQNTLGNAGTSSPTTFRVDTEAPSVTLTAPPQDALLAGGTPSFSGAAGTATGDSSTVTVKVYSGSSATGTPVQTRQATASGGAWSVAASPALADGTYTARAEQSDGAGNTGLSGTRTFSVDTAAPGVTLDTPVDGSTGPDTTPTLSGAAGTAPGDSNTVTVKVYAGTSATGSPLQTQNVTQSGGSWSVPASPALSDGTYTARAEQSDATGNTGLSTPATFTIDSAAPAVTLNAPANGSVTSDSTPHFAGNAGNRAGDSQTVTVRVYPGASPTGFPAETLQATRNGSSWAVEPLTGLADGQYTAIAEQLDGDGGVGTSAPNTFTIDTAAPAVTLDAPANGSSLVDGTPTFSGAAGTAPGDSSTVTVKVYAGSSASGSPVQTRQATASGGAWSVAASPALADGTYTARAEQGDHASNTGLSAASTFTVDTAAPNVTLTTPADGSVSSDTTPTFAGGAGTAAGDSSTVTVNVYAGSTATGIPVTTLTAQASGGSWTVEPLVGLGEGTYTARAEQADQHSTGTSSSNTFRIDTTAPVVTLTAPSNGSTTTDRTPDFAGGAGNLPGDAQTVTVKIWSGSTPSGTPQRTLQATRTGTAWTVTPSSDLALGIYTARAEQGDSAGQTGFSSAATFTVEPASASSAYAQAVRADSPRAYWRLGEASGVFAADETSNANVGSFGGGALLGQPGPLVGDPDTAVSFDGVDDYMTAPDSQSLDITGAATVEAWVKRSKSGAYQVIVGKPGDGQSKRENYALWLNTANQPTAYFGNGSTYVGVASSTAIDTNWHHLAATYDNATARLYIDGSLSKSVTSTVQIGSNSDPLNLARSGSGNPYRFGGLLDEVAVYGTALSSTRIKAHYDTARGNDGVAPSVTLTDPANGLADVSSTPTFSGAAGTDLGDSATVTVKVYAGPVASGTPVQTRQATRSGASWSVAASPALANGTYTARAEQSDAAGNLGLSSANTFTVGPAPPPPPPSAYRNEVMNDGPRAYWRLGESSGGTAIDQTTNQNHGGYQQGVQLGVSGAIGGDADTAVSFDGIDDYLSAPSTASLNLTSAATVEAWVKRSKGSDWQVLVGKPGNGESRLENYALWINPSNRLVGFFGNGTTYASVTSVDPIDTSWHHVVVTYSNQARLYIDGVLNAQQPANVSLTANSQPLNVARANDDSFHFGGRLDEVAIYGTALSATRIQTHYQTGVGPDLTPPVVTLTTPEPGTRTIDTTPAFAGMATVTASDSPTVTLKLYSGTSATGTPAQTLTTTRFASGAWNVAGSTALPAGTYTAQAEQLDTAGNVGKSTASTFSIAARSAVGSDQEFIGAGDIAYCDGTGDEATAALLDQFASATVFTLGDNAYESGTTQEFNNCYQPSWGRAKARTRPSLGDHDFADGADPNGTGYFGYFATQLAPFGASATDPARGYYSYDLGSWHVVVLNAVCGGAASNCVVANQITWLRADLAAHPTSCTAALLSAPRYSSGSIHGNNSDMQTYWSELAGAGVELVMSGDDHDYERFAPMDTNGNYSANGVRQLVIGSGGRSHYLFSDPGGVVKAQSEVRDDATFGIMRLVLRTGGYDWEFVPEAGKAFIDSGSDTCH
jgi:hypothetical protein